MSFPKQINPDVIQEAVVEIRFNSELPPDAIFGVVYNSLKTRYREFGKLPILQIPEAVRNNDPQLIYQPHYKMRYDRFAVQVGPKMFSVSIVENYTTWKSYVEEIISIFENVKQLGFVTNVSRFGLRYVNHFETGIFKNLNLELKIIDAQIEDEEIYIRTVIPKGDFKVLLQIGNQLILKEDDADIGRVSLIDTDIFTVKDSISFFEDMQSLLETAHQLQKETFFGLLKKEFLESLTPEY